MNILNNNGRYFIFNGIDLRSKFEAKNYTLEFDAKSGNVWLEDGKEIVLPAKVYDDSAKMRNMIKISYGSNSKNLGVLLHGNKGQGKSLTLSLICSEMSKEYSLPVIEINKKIPSSVDFISFLKSIDQDYILLIDEFEKLFDPETEGGDDYHDQVSFLAFMNGVYSSSNKVLFLLASNRPANEYMQNRPSRIKFSLEYNELSDVLFNMIVDDKLINKAFKEDLEANVSLANLNIDTLISIIEDINMFNEPFSEFKQFYNYKASSLSYEVSMTIEGVSTDKYQTTARMEQRPKPTNTYLCGYNVKRFTKFTKEEITFETDPQYNGERTERCRAYITLKYMKPMSMKDLVM